MPNCSICYEPFASPVSLPCGHVFCRECIRRAVDSVKAKSILHACPTCRRPYSVVTIDPALIPPFLQPHVLPSIRQVFLDGGPTTPLGSSTPVSVPLSTSSTPQTDLAAELHTLRAQCALWQRRATIHAAANTNLLALARTAKDCALRLRSERDAARTRCALLKRALPRDSELVTPDTADADADRKFACRDVAARGSAGGAGLPVYLMQGLGRPVSHFYDDPRDAESCRFGPPMKRRRVDSKTPSGCARDEGEDTRATAAESTVRSPGHASTPSVPDLDAVPVSFPVSDARSISLPLPATSLSLGNVADNFP